jgi:hypothetical protein
MDLIDALSSHHQVDSITQLSLSPFFRRKYNSITKVISDFLYRNYEIKKNGKIELVQAPCKKAHQALEQLFNQTCEPCQTRNFFYLALMPRPVYVPTPKK